MKPDECPTVESPSVPLWRQAHQVDLRNCVLVIERGPDAGRRFGPLGEQTTIGREPWADIGLTDPEVSKLHCELVRAGNGMRVRDLGSHNGVFIDDMQVDGVALGRSFAFTIGATTLRVLFLDGTQPHAVTVMDQSDTLVGASPPMRRLFSMLDRIAPQEMPVLLLGETGTGKTAIAEAIHKTSLRKHGPFASVNCATLSAEFIDSQLFGHARGAFTGAHATKRGTFEEGSGGTVFLDEIGELPHWLQSKLLTALDSGVFRPLGADRDVRADFRLICATNRDLQDEVKKGQFRQDLYFRVARMPITVPPLRERLGDIGMLAQWFIQREADNRQATGRVCTVRAISPQAILVLQKRGWPGNLRELESAIVNSIAFAGSPVLGPDDLLLDGWVPDATLSGKAECAEPTEPTSDEDPAYSQSKAAHDRDYFRRLHKKYDGNVASIARACKLSRQQVYNQLKKLGLLPAETGRIIRPASVPPREPPRAENRFRPQPGVVYDQEIADLVEEMLRSKEQE